MATVTIHSDFRAQEEEICHYFHFFPSICREVIGLDVMILIFFFFKILFYFLTLQYCIGFAIYRNESAPGIHNV